MLRVVVTAAIVVVFVSHIVQAQTGIDAVFDPSVTPGTSIAIQGPPETARDTDLVANSVESVRALMESRQGPGSIYASLRPNWLTVQHPNATLGGISALIQQRYNAEVMSRFATPVVTHVDVEHLTLNYPVGYYENAAPVAVHARRLTLHAGNRSVVAYYLNYDKVNPAHSEVVFQANGHFGSNPSQIGLGMKDRGGLMGGAVGKMAMQGLPLITYDDHSVGESTGPGSGLPRTLEDMQIVDQVLLKQFDRVDAVGLSGGTERLYHYLMFHESNLASAYLAGFAVPQWTRIDATQSGDSPFGSDADTHDDVFASRFQFSELSLVGIHKGINLAFAHNSFEGGKSKYGYFEEIVPDLLQYGGLFQTRGDDINGDGISDTGRMLSHEYDLQDYFAFLNDARIPEPGFSAHFLVVLTFLRRR